MQTVSYIVRKARGNLYQKQLRWMTKGNTHMGLKQHRLATYAS